MFKNLLFIASILFLSISINAQKQIMWFDAGLKIQSGPTGLFNKAIADSEVIDYAISSGLGFGGKFGINFGYSGLAIDVMYNTNKAEFDHQEFTGMTEVTTKNLDMYLLFRDARHKGYFEIGPKFSFLKDATYRVISAEQGVPLTNVKGDYKNGISAVIGFGANLVGNDGRFSGQLGLRFEYGITDVASETGISNHAPTRVAAIFSDGYKGTHPIFAGVVFELNWGIGYYGKTKCGGKSKFFMF